MNMKRLLIFAIALLPILANGQNIIMDKTSSSGFRYIGTDIKAFGKTEDHTEFSYGLAHASDSIREDYEIMIGVKSLCPYSIHKGDRLLIKTYQGNIIRLLALYDSDATWGDYHNNFGASYKDYSATMFYGITQEQILILCGEGVAKVRMETDTDYFEIEYTKNKISPYIIKCYQLIESALQKQDSFEDNF